MTTPELQTLQRALRVHVEEGKLPIALKRLKDPLHESSKKAAAWAAKILACSTCLVFFAATLPHQFMPPPLGNPTTILKNAPSPIAQTSAGAVLADFETDMARVEGGRMLLGNANGPADETQITMPVHEVEFSGFFISKFEVTQAQWRLVMGTNPSRHTGCDECPVENVSWDDVQVFLQKLNGLSVGKPYRLPTESEWEYAARGGQNSKNFALAGSDDVEEVGWFGNNSGGKPHPVGKRVANELGLFDMSGNAKEWCADPWHDTYNGAPGHSVVWEKGGDTSRRVVRGGSFNSPTPPLCRSTARDRQPKGAQMMTLGFRVARD